MLKIVQTINMYLSDYILIVLMIGCGLYFSIRTRFVQVRCFGEGMRLRGRRLVFRGFADILENRGKHLTKGRFGFVHIAKGLSVADSPLTMASNSKAAA